jgi:hypothetical protein
MRHKKAERPSRGSIRSPGCKAYRKREKVEVKQTKATKSSYRIFSLILTFPPSKIVGRSSRRYVQVQISNRRTVRSELKSKIADMVTDQGFGSLVLPLQAVCGTVTINYVSSTKRQTDRQTRQTDLPVRKYLPSHSVLILPICSNVLAPTQYLVVLL